MKFETINRRYTETVAKWMAKGYTINTATMGGSQGEHAKIDLTNGTEIIRVLLDDFGRPCEKIGDRYYHMEGVELIIGRVTDTVTPNSSNTWNTVWNGNLEIITSEKFYEIGKAHRSGEKWYGTRDEAVAQQNKQWDRYRNTYEPNNQPLSDAAKEIVLPFVRRQPKCKTAKPSEIDVTKHHIESRTGKRYVKYTIKVRGQVFDLH